MYVQSEELNLGLPRANPTSGRMEDLCTQHTVLNFSFIVTHSNLENVLTQTSSSRSQRLTKASALPVAKYLTKIKRKNMHHYFVRPHLSAVPLSHTCSSSKKKQNKVRGKMAAQKEHIINILFCNNQKQHFCFTCTQIQTLQKSTSQPSRTSDDLTSYSQPSRASDKVIKPEHE